MASPFDLSKLVAVSGAVDPSITIGSVVLYEVPSVDADGNKALVSAEVLADACKAVGIEPPNDISAVDAFRRATRDAEIKRIPISGSKDHFNLKVHELRCTEGRVYRELVRERIDSSNIRISFEELVQWVYHREHKMIQAVPLVDPLPQEAQDAISQVNAQYEIERSHYPNNMVRDLMRSHIEAASGVALKSNGGLYFVPKDSAIQVRAILAFTQYLREHRFKLQAVAMPVIDCPSHREMFLELAEERMRTQAISLAAKIRAHLKNPSEKVPPAVTSRYLEELKEMERVAGNYAELFEASLTNVQAQIELAQVGLTALMSR